MDDADRAKEYEMRHRDAALKAQKRNAEQTEKPITVRGVRVCLDCFDPIPLARIEAFPEVVRCVECKQIHERREAKA